MFGKLSALFTGKDELEMLAERGDARALGTALQSRRVLVPRRPHRFLDAAGFTPAGLQELIEESARLASVTPFEPWILTVGGRRLLPAFSSQAKAENFSRRISTELNQVFALSTVELLVSDVTGQIAVDSVELNLFSAKSWRIEVPGTAG